jgi:two-component system, response regulator PdtaR
MLQMADFAAAGTTVSAPGKILVVEDEQLVSMFLVDLLEDLGHEVLGTARSLSEAISLAQADPPRLAIVDHHILGDADGIAVARELSSRFGTEIILMTGSSGIEAAIRGSGMNPVAVLPKPCDHLEIADAVRRGLLQKR